MRLILDQAGQANNQPGIIFLKKLVMLLAAAAVALIINFLPLQIFNNDGLDTLLTLEGKAALAILSFVIILWITEVVPFVIAALTGILLVPLFGLVPFKETVSYGFGNTVVVFFIGILIISVGLTRSGLADRLTGMILAKVGLNSRKLVFIFLLIGAVLSMWIVNMSVSAILLPIALNILHKCKALPLKSNFGRALMISVAWGPAIGGISTPVGNGANIVALGYLRELAGIDINFLSWMTVGVPAAILILPLSYLILIKIFPPEPLADGLEESTVLTGNRGEKIEMTAVEKKALVIFLLAVIFWVGDPLLIRLTGVSIPIEIVALSAAVLFFLPGIEIISWKEAQKNIDWGAIVLIAAGLSLGAVVYETGAAAWLASTAFSPLGEFTPAVRIFLAVLAVELLKVFFSSNTVTGVIMVPLVIALSVKMSIDPWMLAGPVAIATSLAFLLVTSSPTNVIPYSSGYFSIRDFLKAGLPLTLLVPFAVTASFLIFGAFLR
ncbi:MAG: DASS family sodium-coupled anion symporter [Bacillota bacterium]|nr:DASS family sodium-coupled anion symporter [Bacillota bacterium]